MKPCCAECLISDLAFKPGTALAGQSPGLETCFKMKGARDRSVSISQDMVDQAKENLITRWETHLDQLADIIARRPGS